MDEMSFPQQEADRMFTELGELWVELDDDPLIYGPKRLNSKTSQVRRMLDRLEKLYLSVSKKLQLSNRAMRIAVTDLDIAKKELFANDPETMSGRSVSDREAIASGKLEREIKTVNELHLTTEDLNAVLVVIKAKRADLKDTESRLRDQIRLCSEEIGLGGRWGSKVPGAPEVNGRPAMVSSNDGITDLMVDFLAGVDSEITLSRDDGTWSDGAQAESVADTKMSFCEEIDSQITKQIFDHVDRDTTNSVDLPSVVQEPVVHRVIETKEFDDYVVRVMSETHDDHVKLVSLAIEDSISVATIGVPVVLGQKSVPIAVDLSTVTPTATGDIESSMPPTATNSEVDIFLSEVNVHDHGPVRPNVNKMVDSIDVDSILDMFESNA